MSEVGRRRVPRASDSLAARSAASHDKHFAALSADEISSLPCIQQEPVEPPSAPKDEQGAVGGQAIVDVKLIARPDA